MAIHVLSFIVDETKIELFLSGVDSTWEAKEVQSLSVLSAFLQLNFLI
jgi:hypothetical protein